MTGRAALALALLSAPLPALAQPVAATFAPPLDREIRYEVVETRHRGGLKLGFTLDQRVRFVREGRGYRMTVTLRSATTDAPAAIAERFDASFRPFVGFDTALLLSPEGKPMGLVDEQATWSRLLAAIDTLRKDKRLAPAAAATIEAVFASIAALPPEARQAKLMENPLRLVGYALPPMSPGGSIESGDAREGATAVLKQVDAVSLGYTVYTRRPLSEAAMLTSEGEVVVDRASGLLRRAATREWVGAADRASAALPDAEVSVRLVE